MKKILLIALLSTFAVCAAAHADVTQSAMFQWEQGAEDLPNMGKWTLKMSDVAGGIVVQAIDIPYTSGAGPFTTQQQFTVSVPPGQTVQKFFRISATSKNGKESGDSNEVPLDFTAPYNDVTTPLSLTVTIVVQ